MMGKNFLYTFIILLFIGGYSIQVSAEDDDDKYAVELLKTGTSAPDFKLTDINGNAVSLSQFKGKYVVIDFWASWCPDCRKDAPNIVNLYNMYKDKGVVFIGVSFDNDKKAWTSAVNQIGMKYYSVCELKKWHDTIISGLYQIKWIPSMYLVGPDGKVALSTVMSDKLAARLAEVTK
jgi:peroxiredoxin